MRYRAGGTETATPAIIPLPPESNRQAPDAGKREGFLMPYKSQSARLRYYAEYSTKRRRKCVVCGKAFESRFARQTLTCSHECSRKNSDSRRRGRQQVTFSPLVVPVPYSHRSLTAELMNDPPPGRSALDHKLYRQAQPTSPSLPQMVQDISVAEAKGTPASQQPSLQAMQGCRQNNPCQGMRPRQAP